MSQPTPRVAHRDPVVSRNCRTRSPFRTQIQQRVELQRTSSVVVLRFERRTSRIYARKRSTTVPDDLLRETDLRRIARHWKLHSPAIGWMDHTLVREKISRPMPPSITSFSSTVFRSSDALRPFVTQLRSVVSWNSDHRSSARSYMLILPTVHGLETGSSGEPRANDSHSVRSIFVDTIIEVTFYISFCYIVIDHGWLLELAPEYRKYVNTCPSEVCGCECPARGCRDALRDARSDRNCGHDGNAPASSAIAPLTRSNPELLSPPPDTSPLRRHFSDRARHSACCHSLLLASTRFPSATHSPCTARTPA